MEFYLAGTSTPTNIFSDNSGTVVGTSVELNSGGYPESGGNVLTLFRDSSVNLKIVGKNAAGTTIWTADNLKDSLVILASTSNGEGASLVGVENSSSYYTGANVEAALDNIGQNSIRADRNHSNITGTYVFNGGLLNLADSSLVRAKLVDFAIAEDIVTSSSGAVTFDLTSANTFSITLTENITSMTISNPPVASDSGQFTVVFTQDGGGGAYTVAWPASVLWPGGTGPTISTANDAIDMVTLYTNDAGTTWLGAFSQAYS